MGTVALFGQSTYVIDFIYYTIPNYMEFWPMTGLRRGEKSVFSQRMVFGIMTEKCLFIAEMFVKSVVLKLSRHSFITVVMTL